MFVYNELYFVSAIKLNQHTLKGRYKMKNLFMAAFMALFVLAGCQQGAGQKQQLGTGAGAILGGLAGSQIGDGSGQLIAVGAGTLLGALAGSEIGKSLDRADKIYMQRAADKATSAPLGETITWNNPESPNRGTVTPVRDGYSEAGRYCREFQQTIIVGGREQEAYGTACQQPDGSWEIMS